MEINKKQFSILAILATEKETLTQRQIEKLTNYSLGTINKIIKELTEIDLVNNGKITKKGLEVLEHFKVKRAVFIAAGFGSRLVPITLNTPKPLVRVNGVRIIDGLIDACLKAGIDDIIIVRGYLGEQFDQLLYKYPKLKFIDNPLYNEANNISSALVAKDYLKNAYVFEADLLISNPSIIRTYHYCSNFLGIKTERSDDWCFVVKNGLIKEQKVGGINCYQMVGISYWNEEDGVKLSTRIKEAYEMPGGKELYWEQIPLSVFKNDFKVAIRECKQDDIVEIDTFGELKAIDKSYDI